VSDHEVLDVGGDRGPQWSWRRRLAVAVTALALTVAVLAADRGLRRSEERAVQACADEVAAAVRLAGSRVRAVYEYVRPSLVHASPELQTSVRRLVAGAATGSGAELAGPRRTCRDVRVWPLHDDLQARRERCLEVITAHRAGLAAVATDGRAISAWLSVPRSC
jgi:hypothetical protein